MAACKEKDAKNIVRGRVQSKIPADLENQLEQVLDWEEGCTRSAEISYVVSKDGEAMLYGSRCYQDVG